MRKLLFIFVILVFMGLPAHAVVINEIMYDPDSVTDANGEWFELYNEQAIEINIIGWEIKDDGTNSHIINENLVIPTNGYIVLCKNNDFETNGGVDCDYVYSSFTLGNSDDEIILMNGLTEVDRVEYDEELDFPNPTGKSIELKDSSLDNNIGLNWVEATTIYGDGDYGTPDSVNSIYIEFTLYPEYVAKDQTPFAVELCAYNLAGEDYGLGVQVNTEWDESGKLSETWNHNFEEWDESVWGIDIEPDENNMWCGFVYLSIYDLDEDGLHLLEKESYIDISAEVVNWGTEDSVKTRTDSIDLLDHNIPEPGYEPEGGVSGGYLEGFYPKLPEGFLVLIKDEEDNIITFYTVEDNLVDEERFGFNHFQYPHPLYGGEYIDFYSPNDYFAYSEERGYFNLAVPEGNWTMEIVDEDWNALMDKDITIEADKTTFAGYIYQFWITQTITPNEDDIFQVVPEKEYKLFEIESFDIGIIDREEPDEPLNIVFNWDVSNETDLIAEGTDILEFPNQTLAGSWTPEEEGVYMVCGEVVSAGVGETEIYNAIPEIIPDESNSYCYELTVSQDTSEKTCNVTLNLEMEDTEYEQGDIISFNISIENDLLEKHDSLLKWSIEDFGGNIVKEKYKTISLDGSEKSIENQVKISKSKTGNFILKAELQDAGCNAIKSSFDSGQFSVLPTDNLAVYMTAEDFYVSNDTANISLQFTNGFEHDIRGVLNLKIKRIGGIFGYEWEVAKEVVEISSNSVSEKNYEWTVPLDAITGKYKIYLRFKYEKAKTRYFTFDVEGIEDLGEPYFEILGTESPVRFGDFSYLTARYFAGNYNQKLRFVGYVDKPKHVSVDLERDSIYSKYCEKDTAIEETVERGGDIILALPIFLKDNCDGDYTDGNYLSYGRVCRWTGEWGYMSPSSEFRKPFNLEIKGNNDELCGKEVRVSSGGNSGGGGSSMVVSSTVPKTKLVSIAAVNLSKKANEGSEIESVVTVKNNYKTKKKFEVYSYVYLGSKIASEGGWTANKKEIEIEGGKSKEVRLKNIIKEDVRGEYKLKVRVKDGSKNYDLIEDIEIFPGIEGMEMEGNIGSPTDGIMAAKIQARDEQKLEEVWETRETPSGITGMAAVKESGIVKKVFVFIDWIKEFFGGLVS